MRADRSIEVVRVVHRAAQRSPIVALGILLPVFAESATPNTDECHSLRQSFALLLAWVRCWRVRVVWLFTTHIVLRVLFAARVVCRELFAAVVVWRGLIAVLWFVLGIFVLVFVAFGLFEFAAICFGSVVIEAVVAVHRDATVVVLGVVIGAVLSVVIMVLNYIIVLAIIASTVRVRMVGFTKAVIVDTADARDFVVLCRELRLCVLELATLVGRGSLNSSRHEERAGGWRQLDRALICHRVC